MSGTAIFDINETTLDLTPDGRGENWFPQISYD